MRDETFYFEGRPISHNSRKKPRKRDRNETHGKAESPKKKLDKRNTLCIIDLTQIGGQEPNGYEKVQFLFSGYTSQEAESDSKENWASSF